MTDANKEMIANLVDEFEVPDWAKEMVANEVDEETDDFGSLFAEFDSFVASREYLQ